MRTMRRTSKKGTVNSAHLRMIVRTAKTQMNHKVITRQKMMVDQMKVKMKS